MAGQCTPVQHRQQESLETPSPTQKTIVHNTVVQLARPPVPEPPPRAATTARAAASQTPHTAPHAASKASAPPHQAPRHAGHHTLHNRQAKPPHHGNNATPTTRRPAPPRPARCVAPLQRLTPGGALGAWSGGPARRPAWRLVAARLAPRSAPRSAPVARDQGDGTDLAQTLAQTILILWAQAFKPSLILVGQGRPWRCLRSGPLAPRRAAESNGEYRAYRVG